MHNNSWHLKRVKYNLLFINYVLFINIRIWACWLNILNLEQCNKEQETRERCTTGPTSIHLCLQLHLHKLKKDEDLNKPLQWVIKIKIYPHYWVSRLNASLPSPLISSIWMKRELNISVQFVQSCSQLKGADRSQSYSYLFYSQIW